MIRCVHCSSEATHRISAKMRLISGTLEVDSYACGLHEVEVARSLKNDFKFEEVRSVSLHEPKAHALPMIQSDLTIDH